MAFRQSGFDFVQLHVRALCGYEPRGYQHVAHDGEDHALPYESRSKVRDKNGNSIGHAGLRRTWTIWLDAALFTTGQSTSSQHSESRQGRHDPPPICVVLQMEELDEFPQSPTQSCACILGSAASFGQGLTSVHSPFGPTSDHFATHKTRTRKMTEWGPHTWRAKKHEQPVV